MGIIILAHFGLSFLSLSSGALGPHRHIFFMATEYPIKPVILLIFSRMGATKSHDWVGSVNHTWPTEVGGICCYNYHSSVDR